VTPPLRIRIEHSSTVDEKIIPSLEEKMEKHFKEDLRISPTFIWVSEGSIPREMKKTKFIQIEEDNSLHFQDSISPPTRPAKA
jgi:phenylacetate-coenzyme A ligase PaaK-like adenylate-forming protein